MQRFQPSRPLSPKETKQTPIHTHTPRNLPDLPNHPTRQERRNKSHDRHLLHTHKEKAKQIPTTTSLHQTTRSTQGPVTRRTTPTTHTREDLNTQKNPTPPSSDPPDRSTSEGGKKKKSKIKIPPRDKTSKKKKPLLFATRSFPQLLLL